MFSLSPSLQNLLFPALCFLSLICSNSSIGHTCSVRLWLKYTQLSCMFGFWLLFSTNEVGFEYSKSYELEFMFALAERLQNPRVAFLMFSLSLTLRLWNLIISYICFFCQWVQNLRVEHDVLRVSGSKGCTEHLCSVSWLLASFSLYKWARLWVPQNI
jgi:hypothetical protein